MLKKLTSYIDKDEDGDSKVSEVEKDEEFDLLLDSVPPSIQPIPENLLSGIYKPPFVFLPFLELGTKTSFFIHGLSNSLRMLNKIISDFPKYAHILASHEFIDDEKASFKKYVSNAMENQRRFSRINGRVFLNGVMVDFEHFNMFRYDFLILPLFESFIVLFGPSNLNSNN